VKTQRPITEQTLNEKIREHYSTLNGVTIAISRVKVKVGFLYSATYTADQEQRALTISQAAVDWQEPMVLQRKCGHPLSALTDTGPAVAASKHITAPINHTRPSPRKHSPDGATQSKIANTRLLLTTQETGETSPQNLEWSGYANANCPPRFSKISLRIH